MDTWAWLVGYVRNNIVMLSTAADEVTRSSGVVCSGGSRPAFMSPRRNAASSDAPLVAGVFERDWRRAPSPSRYLDAKLAACGEGEETSLGGAVPTRQN